MHALTVSWLSERQSSGFDEITHPDLLPGHVVEEHVAPLLLFHVYLYRLG